MGQSSERTKDEEGSMSAREQPASASAGKSYPPGARIRYYWTFIVAALLFIIIGIPIIVIGHILKRVFGVDNFIFPYAQFGVRLYVRSSGARVHVSGLERLDRRATYVFIANHQSNLDPPILFAYLHRNIGALAKKELARIPILGQGMPLAHVIPVDRGNHERAMESTRRGAEALRRGHDLMAFPEGTRTVDGRIKPFKKGVFFMAIEAGVAVAPVVINDTRLVMRKGTPACFPGDVFVEVLPPVSTTNYNRENIDELLNHVRELILPHVRTD
jgi:1-acyl-sn-glycerol-3-phosphate acyltransferase